MEKPKYLHERIRERVIESLRDYRIGDRLPSDRELARRFGAAFLTVNKVVSELEREGFFVRRQGKGTFLVSREKSVHREGRVRNGEILIGYPDYFSSEYWTRVHTSGELAMKSGTRLVEFKQNEHSGMEKFLETASELRDLRGVMIDPVPGILTGEIFRELRTLKVPVVIFTALPANRVSGNIYSVVPDWFDIARLRVRTLWDAGYRRLASISNEPGGQDNGRTTAGIKQALKECGLRYKDLIRVSGHVKPWQNSCQAGYGLTRDLFRKSFADGLIYDSAAGALGGVKYLLERGYGIPDTIGIVSGGYLGGGLEEFAYPGISTVSSSIPYEVEKAFEIILKGGRPQGNTFTCPSVVSYRGSIRTGSSLEVVNE